jgi:hypothetical protein
MDPSASLANLRDIAVPEPPPMWPPAPGVWVLLIVAVALAAALAVYLWRRWSDNAYRRAGIALLEDARTTRDVNIVLKRVALAVFSRPEVASLYGDDWSAFLDACCSGVRFAGIERQPDDAEASRQLKSMAGTWIRRHRRSGG